MFESCSSVSAISRSAIHDPDFASWFMLVFCVPASSAKWQVNGTMVVCAGSQYRLSISAAAAPYPSNNSSQTMTSINEVSCVSRRRFCRLRIFSADTYISLFLTHSIPMHSLHNPNSSSPNAANWHTILGNNCRKCRTVPCMPRTCSSPSTSSAGSCP